MGPTLCLLTALLGAPAIWVADGGETSYTVVHKLHEVVGTSRNMEVRALLDDGGLKVMARTLVKSFDSGNSNRDAHVQEVVDAARFPAVTVRALLPDYKLPDSPAKAHATLKGEVELHGVKKAVPIEADIERLDATHVVVRFTLVDSLTAHDIERPSLLFVPVDDALKIRGTVNLHLQANP